ncbi:ATP-dependent helicase [bacterium]|nr:ATP-dependent helicase [bacterium]
MFIKGSLASDKTELLIDKYVDLLNHGVSASEILVLVQNSTRKSEFQKKVYEKLEVDCIERLQIHSFFSLVYNTVLDNWAFLEERNIFDNPAILPNLCGLEVSQFILKDILKDVKFKGYNSRMSLLQQIFRRYALIVQNNLKPSEVEERAKILKEGFSDEASLAISKLLKRTLELRGFDYLRQCLVFNFVYKNTSYFSGIKYLFIDDADECTPICIDFVEYLSKQLSDFYIAIDPEGSSRCGYLSADKNNFEHLKTIFKDKTYELIDLNENSKLVRDVERLYGNIFENKVNVLENFSLVSCAKRSEIIDIAVKKVKSLLNFGILPCEISIVTPIVDEMLRFSLKENFKNITPLYLTGSEKLIQNKLVYAAITILKLNTDLKSTVSEFDIRVILYEILRIPLKYCQEILENFEKTKNLIPYEFCESEYTEEYKTFTDLVESLSTSDKKLSEQIIEIYNVLYNFNSVDKNEINKFNFFIKQITDFENIFGKDFNNRKSDIILQIENSIISENPYSVLEIDNDNLIISTPQKIIDNQVKTKYQIWLDVSNAEWIKSDTGPLYNAWVFQKDWDKNEYTIEDNIQLSKDKNARVLRKLALCASEHIYCAFSLFDSNGVENYGALEEYIITQEDNSADEKEEQVFKIIPREDQKPVLEYKSGYMGISAVPGAGKTTILLALIIKLLERGIDPERIFVLTYMGSAARNFRERIKNVRKNSSKMPNISTIHGLALRILKENGNYEKLGLSADFEICDDSQRSRILKEISSQLGLKQKMAEEFDRAVSVYKIGRGVFPENITDKKLKQFSEFYLKYQESLKEFNLIDYDDMLIGSVKILEDNEDILAHYQDICEYIIEDEAQDSSSVQQKLITLLSGKYKNVIRCGDVNQSITATFSNADVEGFRRFITENQNVSMDCSQRCAHDVWECANSLVKWSLTDDVSKNSFFEMYMHPVEGKNPQDKDAVSAQIFDTPINERNSVLNLIKTTLAKNPDYTVGVLLRNNYQVTQWQSLLVNSGFSVITRNQCLEQKNIFRSIFAVLQIILHPFDNNVLGENFDTLYQMGVYKQGLGYEIRKYENPIITIDCDNFANTALEQFYWDVNYWISLCSLPPNELVIKIAQDLRLLKTDIDKSNIYLISTLVKRICMNNNSLEYAVNRLGELAKRPNLSGFKFFSEEDEDDKKSAQGKIQIMTMHKSKGDEFNLVVIPELSEKNLPLSVESITLKSADFLEEIRAFNPQYKQKSELELKQEILAENLRLLYVAITRAKNKLFLCASKKEQSFGKLKDSEPNIIFDEVLQNVERSEV